MPMQPPIHRPRFWSAPRRVRTDAMDRFYDSPEWRATRERIKRRDGYRCVKATCRTPNRGHGGRLIVDHIVPRRAGGGDDDANLQTLWPACDNRERSLKRAAAG